MRNTAFFLLLLLCGAWANAQSKLTVIVSDGKGQPIAGAMVTLLRGKDSSLVKLQVADTLGTASFNVPDGNYLIKGNCGGFADAYYSFFLPATTRVQLQLQPFPGLLTDVTVTAHKPLIELQPGKTTINVENSITQAGTTVMEALEKLPGITIDKDGNIALKGKTGVQVLIDGKPLNLGAEELSVLLNSMSASGVSQIELMDVPPVRYDAAGNAGAINIKTKKSNQKGLYGSITASFSQGVYPKNNNSLQLGYRSGKWNLFANYSLNASSNFTRLLAYRTYFKADEKTVTSLLDQNAYIISGGNTQNLRLGADYAINLATSIGISLSGLLLDRNSKSNNKALWMNPQKVTDSLISTLSQNTSNWKNGGANLAFRHTFRTKDELTADVDWFGYRIRATQLFDHSANTPIYYKESSRATIPTDITIYSAKTDYAATRGSWRWEGGAKFTRIETDNLSNVEQNKGNGWMPDLNKTNHFIYTESIKAAYLNAQTASGPLTLQAGLRFEGTNLHGNQLGNAVVKDSSFSRSYADLFPSVSIQMATDSGNTFSFSASRRIDRPPFQKLNPFLVVINKYTYQRGNAYYRPQYTWNFELSHSYKNALLTSFSYSITNDFFNQVFPVDSTGIIIYTVGNLGKLQVLGLSVGTQLQAAKWWSVTAQAALNHRMMQGEIDKRYNVSFTQFTLNMSNQFRLPRNWSAELSGNYSSKSRIDIQEITDPTGQLSAGFSKAVLHNKGTLKFSVRDLFYTQQLKGLTYFQRANEWFDLRRDTRLFSVSFTYRFGDVFKITKRSPGGAGEEIDRVGNGQ